MFDRVLNAAVDAAIFCEKVSFKIYFESHGLKTLFQLRVSGSKLHWFQYERNLTEIPANPGKENSKQMFLWIVIEKRLQVQLHLGQSIQEWTK